MRSIRICLVVAGAILALALAPATASATSTKAFHLEKTCSGFTCVVTSSSFRKIPAGTTISYSGTPEALVATINVRHGSATGNCNIASVFATPSAPGHCTFDVGTGSLRGFHLDVAVTLDSTGVWHWDGRYRFGCGRHGRDARHDD